MNNRIMPRLFNKRVTPLGFDAKSRVAANLMGELWRYNKCCSIADKKANIYRTLLSKMTINHPARNTVNSLMSRVERVSAYCNAHLSKIEPEFGNLKEQVVSEAHDIACKLY